MLANPPMPTVKVKLSRVDLQLILIGKELKNLHVSFFHKVVKRQFPHIGGLQYTLLQSKSPLDLKEFEQAVYVIHT